MERDVDRTDPLGPDNRRGTGIFATRFRAPLWSGAVKMPTRINIHRILRFLGVFVVAVAGPSCAAGHTLGEVELETAPYTTYTHGFTVLSPRVTV